MSAEGEKYLFVGVGGTGMAPLASWMAASGCFVSGYDVHLQESTRVLLEKAGVVLYDFLFPEQIGDYTTLVYSSAVPQDHPLLTAARERRLCLLRRGEMLATIARDKRLIAIAGSHGKTTTSGMIAHGLPYCGIEVNYILGGRFSDPEKAPSHYCESEWLIAEVDESDGTIDAFSPEVSLVLNVDWDHADRYSESADLEATFSGLLARTRQMVLLPGHLSHLTGSPAEIRFFDGSPEQPNTEAPPPGSFNKSNREAASSVLSFLSDTVPKNALSTFGGMNRRQSILYSDESTVLIQDYAHHPTEIEAFLATLTHSDRRVIAVFQPHRYSRTRQFKSEFALALKAADEVILLPVYAAFEDSRNGADSGSLAESFSGVRPLLIEPNLSGMEVLRKKISDQRTLLAFIGAGDIEKFASAFTAFLSNQSGLEPAWSGYLKDRISPDCVLKLKEPLAGKTTIGIGGSARFYAEPGNLSDLRELIQSAKLFDLPVFCLGRGSNLIVPDEGFSGLVIRFSARSWRSIQNLGEGRIWSAAGTRLKDICGFAAKNDLAGFEFLEGIPGSVGGALRMNAGAMGRWMFDVVERVRFIDEFGQYQDRVKTAFNFGYRKVEEISRGIALGAVLSSHHLEPEASIRRRIDTYYDLRKSSQPRAASAGCIFKNPEGHYAGKLIDELGLKGMRVGSAEVSDVHANFIVNKGGASASDVIELVKQIRAKVKIKSGYTLEPEVLLPGQSWSGILNE